MTGEELYSFKTPSGIIGNVTTYVHDGKQYIAILSGIGGWAGIGLAAGLTEGTEGLGAVGAYQSLANYTNLGGQLTVFALPEYRPSCDDKPCRLENLRGPMATIGPLFFVGSPWAPRAIPPAPLPEPPRRRRPRHPPSTRRPPLTG